MTSHGNPVRLRKLFRHCLLGLGSSPSLLEPTQAPQDKGLRGQQVDLDPFQSAPGDRRGGALEKLERPVVLTGSARRASRIDPGAVDQVRTADALDRLPRGD